MMCYGGGCMSDDTRDLRESLKQSEANRAAMVQRFGFVPHSVISEINRGSLSKSLFLYQQERCSQGQAREAQGSRLPTQDQPQQCG